MKHSHVDALCAIAARLVQDAATLREFGCEQVARLVEEAERELDVHVYNGGCANHAAAVEAESTTRH